MSDNPMQQEDGRLPSLVERLRAYVGTPFSSPHVDALCNEAADTIQSLQSDLDRQADAIGVLREKLDAAVDALEVLQFYGCPSCGGDCASANPPVIYCPMQQVSATLARIRGEDA